MEIDEAVAEACFESYPALLALLYADLLAWDADCFA